MGKVYVQHMTPVTAYAEDFHIVSGAAGGAHALTHYDMHFILCNTCIEESNQIEP